MKEFCEEVIERIAKNDAKIAGLRLVSTPAQSYSSSQKNAIAEVAKTNASAKADALASAVLSSKDVGVPLSEAFLGHLMANDIQLSADLSTVTRHNAMREIRVIHKSEWRSVMNKLITRSRGRKMIALSSTTYAESGGIRHIPMLDLRLPISSIGQSSAVSMLSELGQEGYLLNSGKSYHFYGSSTVSQDDFIKFLGSALLFSPLVDVPWIAHQLIEGAAALRLSSKADYEHRPYLVAEI